MPYNTKEKQKAWVKRYYQQNRKELIERARYYRLKHLNWKKKYDKKYREKNVKKIKKYLKKWRRKHKEYRREYARQNWLKNKERIQAYKKEWRKRNLQRIKEKSKNYIKNNLERFRVINQNRRTRKKKAKGNFTLQEWYDLKRKYNYHCFMCGKRKKLTIDHIIPLSKGGNNFINNIQPLCFSCNASKRDR